MALLSPKVMNFAYGMGAAIVIIGALFKIAHFEFGPLTGTVMLTIGLVTEALIFAISAFEAPAKEIDWSLVYPELAGGEAKPRDKKKEDPADAQGLLSQKLDNMLKEAKIDGQLMESLGNSIKNFEGAAKAISPTVDSVASTKKYAEEMSALDKAYAAATEGKEQKRIMAEYKKAWKNYVQASMDDNSDLELLGELKFNNLGRGVLIIEK